MALTVIPTLAYSCTNFVRYRAKAASESGSSFITPSVASYGGFWLATASVLLLVLSHAGGVQGLAQKRTFDFTASAAWMYGISFSLSRAIEKLVIIVSPAVSAS